MTALKSFYKWWHRLESLCYQYVSGLGPQSGLNGVNLDSILAALAGLTLLP
jgi:hypothetical protein